MTNAFTRPLITAIVLATSFLNAKADDLGAAFQNPTEETKPLFSPEWYEITRHALEEANRLSIEIMMFNAPGWSQSGGPWIAPEQSMQPLFSRSPNRTLALLGGRSPSEAPSRAPTVKSNFLAIYSPNKTTTCEN